MDYASLTQYVNKNCRLTLNNNFWYRASIISVSKDAVTFIEAKGKKVSVHPSVIMLCEELS